MWERADSQIISWHLELPGNQKDVGLMRIYTTDRDYVGLAPIAKVSTPAVALCRSVEDRMMIGPRVDLSIDL